MHRALIVLMTVSLAAVVMTETEVQAQQRQERESDLFYQVNGLVYVYEFDDNANANDPDTGWEREPWIPSKPLRFEIVRKYTRREKPAPAVPPSPPAGGDPATSPVAPGQVVYVVRFFDIKKDAADNTLRGITTFSLDGTQRSKYITSDQNSKLFWITKDDLDTAMAEGFILKKHHAGIWPPSFTWGAALALPFKLRPKLGEHSRKLETDATLGGYFGLRWRVSTTDPVYVSLVGTAGLVTLPVNSDNTEAGATMETTDDTVLGFTYGGGLVLEFDGFQIGLMLGRDYATGDTGEDWIYNGETWYSFSVGHTFLKDVGK